MTDGPLSDLIVLDLTRALAGPHAAMMLGDMGARVIKVESPTGDDTRWLGSAVRRRGRRARVDVLHVGQPQQGVAGPRPQGRGRQGRAGPAGRARRRADGELPGRRARPARLPGLAAARAQPPADRPVDHRVRARRAGGEARRLRPDRAGRGRADVDHRHRAADQGGRADRRPDRRHERRVRRASPRCTSGRRTGRGRVVRTSLLAGMVGVHAFQGTRWTVAGEVPGLAGDHHPSIAPYGMFATATAPVQIACGSEGLWRALCGAFGWDPAEAEFATNALRVANRDALVERIETLFASEPAEHWLAMLVGGRGAVRQGALDGRRLQLGPGALAGPAAVGRARDAGRAEAAGLADPLRRQPLLRWALRPTWRRRRSASTTSRSGSGWTRESRLARLARGVRRPRVVALAAARGGPRAAALAARRDAGGRCGW